MKIENTSVSIGNKVVDLYLGLGYVESFTPTGAMIRFDGAKGSHEFLDGGFLGGVQRLGFKRKTFIQIPVDKVDIVTKILAVFEVKIEEGF
jgi:hypothetical protein